MNLRDYDVILVNSSGGKDSQAMLDYVAELASRAGVSDRIVVLHNDLGRVEWPGTAELAREQAEHYGFRFEMRHRTQGLLLEQIRQRGRWNATRTVRLYRRPDFPADLPDTKARAVARGDLRDLAAWGFLTLHDEPSNRHYTLNHRKDIAR